MRFLKEHRERKRRFFPWRFAITALLILIQIVITFGFMHLLGRQYVWLQIVFSLQSIFILFFIINKHQPVSYKLPWIVLIFLMPVTGVFIYMAFGVTRLPKKAKKRFLKDRVESNGYLEDEKSHIIEEISENSKDAGAISQYLKNLTGLLPYKNCKSTYLKSGEEFFESLKEELKKAEKYIFMEYFIVSPGSMMDEITDILEEKVKNGVKVYMLYDDIGSMTKMPANFDVECRKIGINCFKFNPFHPVVTVLHNNRDHRKITVIDGKVAFTGGANLADEYINLISPHGHWKDCAVKIEGQAVSSFVVMFVQLYNLFSLEAIDSRDFLVECEKFDESGYIQPFGTGPKPLYEREIGSSMLLSMIHSAKKYLYITTPYLIVDYSMLEALEMCALRGVDVRIITPHIPDKKAVFIMTRSSYEPLIKAGVTIYEYEPGFIHSKSVLCDGEMAFVGTINFDYRSFVHHYECGAFFVGTPSLDTLKNDFLNTIKENGLLQTEKSAKLNFWQKIVKNVVNLFAPLL